MNNTENCEPTIDQAYRAAECGCSENRFYPRIINPVLQIKDVEEPEEPITECDETFFYPGILRPLNREEFYKKIFENIEEYRKPDKLEEEVKYLLSTNSKLLKKNFKLKSDLLKAREQINALIDNMFDEC